jgi:hypothetical protein
MQQTFVVPYLRSSPIHIPRRDLVLAASDSVFLAVSVIESDDPAAEALVITGGIGGPTLRMTVWPDSCDGGRHYHGWNGGLYGGGWFHDYGWGIPRPGTVLWSGTGTIDPDALGTFNILIPIATMTSWPRRCGYALQLDWQGNTRSETLAIGALNVWPNAINGTFAAPRLTTDDLHPIDTDDSKDLFA